ncbi:putative zinc metallo proteinase [Xylona heveae TC161]|uniref:Putative zinc metallo proteinase n=1 Tax=Xylona heveae (strain CBS 132557 / TC161) TaxID=1328760 RepID=A0A165G9W5_XYLHT|nr:putative zinc metallo proteinase [Xylona heveae TC161]KZF21923.1 putative zinc metallo proteinase [Xylona heveae TC161]
MPFFKDLRRRSKTSFKTEKSSSNGSPNGGPERTQSSSTLNSVYGPTGGPGATTPPAMLQSNMSSPNLQVSRTNGSTPPVPPRPSPIPQHQRYSGLGSSNGSLKTMLATSPYAPRLLSVSESTWVHQKILLVYGQIGDPAQQPMDGTLTVCHHQDSFPATSWPVCDSHFKALIHLTPGPNRIRLDFTSPKLASNNSQAHSSWTNLFYLPLNAAPPLQLVILLGKDSPGTFDTVPERQQREGNGLDTAIRKFKMAAYLWQAFTGEQMYRNRFGRRCFRFEEEWQRGTLSCRDADTAQMRNEAKIHIVRTEKTVQELRDLDLAQQYDKATKKGELFSIALDAVRDHFKPAPGQKQYVSVLLLDAHWDTNARTITGHAALGGGAGDIQLAIFGSHALYSYPACIEEVAPVFSDCTRTDTNFVANDCNESGSTWEAANIGIGAHLHETGHLFGCPHQESGVMLRDYVRLNRSFTCREPYSTRTKSPGLKLCLPKDECAWHRLDCLRFRYHPCFRLPTDAPYASDESVHVWTVDNGQAIATAATGVAFIEVFGEGDDICHSFIEFGESNGNGSGGLPKQVNLAEPDLRGRLPDDKRNKRLKLVLHSAAQGSHTVEDFGQLISKTSLLKLPNGQTGFRGGKLGFSQMEGSQKEEVILESALLQTKLLVQVKVYHGFAVDGIEFVYEDFTSQLFGKRGGKPGGSEFSLDTRRGEIIMGFYVRAGLWIDGIEILTSLGRRSGVFGNPLGGSGHTLIPPRGYSIAGISGSCGPWLDGFSLIITR